MNLYPTESVAWYVDPVPKMVGNIERVRVLRLVDTPGTHIAGNILPVRGYFPRHTLKKGKCGRIKVKLSGIEAHPE